MALQICAGCGKLISISSLPGGNPHAMTNYEKYATRYTFCKGCGTGYCADCALDKCGKCGQTLPPFQGVDNKPDSDKFLDLIENLTVQQGIKMNDNEIAVHYVVAIKSLQEQKLLKPTRELREQLMQHKRFIEQKNVDIEGTLQKCWIFERKKSDKLPSDSTAVSQSRWWQFWK